jgi:hypothetical protein
LVPVFDLFFAREEAVACRNWWWRYIGRGL